MEENTQERFGPYHGPGADPAADDVSAALAEPIAEPFAEPIAIVGIGALYPEARDAADYWRLLTAGPRPAAGASLPRTDLADVQVDVARFGIPPAQAASMARMQLLMLEAARQCLNDAGYAERPLPSDRTDVVVGTCFGLDRQYANALRVEGSRYARDLERVVSSARSGTFRRTGALAADGFRSALLRRLGASPHDRVGEMASTIPARIAAAFKLHGRTLALESSDATSYVGMAHSVDSLRQGLADSALVVSGQRHEGRIAARALAAKRETAASPGAASDWLAGAGDGFAFTEGVGALLLKRLSSAVRDGDRVYASILDCTLRHEGRAGVFRYSSSAERHREAAAASYRGAGIRPGSVQYVECAGYGAAQETDATKWWRSAIRSSSDPQFGEPLVSAGFHQDSDAYEDFRRPGRAGRGGGGPPRLWRMAGDHTGEGRSIRGSHGGLPAGPR